MSYFFEILFLRNIIYSTVTGSAIVLMLVFLRRIFGSKLDYEWRYYSWFLLILKLIIPFSLLGGINIISYILPAFRNLDQAAVSVMDSRLLASNPQFDLEKIYQGGISEIHLLPLIQIGAVLWLLGVMIQTGITIFGLVRFNRNIRKCTINTEPHLLEILEDQKRRIGLSRKINLVVTSETQMPATYGVLRPRILLSENLINRVSDRQLEYILLHELIHLKRGDQILNWVFRLVTILHWFNPLIYYAFHKMRQECELSCDESVLNSLKEKEAVDYGETLILMLDALRSLKTPVGTPCFASKKLIPVKRRLGNIMDFHQKDRFRSRWFYFFASAAFIMILLIPAAADAQVFLPSESIQGSMEWPLKNHDTITSAYGLQETMAYGLQETTAAGLHKESFHTGIDIKAEGGTEISAAYRGTVAFSGWDDVYGKLIIIEHSHELITIYAHCSELFVQKGEQVKTGEVIAETGNSGYTSAPHLHFEIRKNGVPADPNDFINYEFKRGT